MKEDFKVYVSYSQIAVFWPTLQEPFNSWNDQDVDRGFSWRPGSVSFRTASEAGEHSIHVSQGEMDTVSESTIRSATVQFNVPEDGLVEVGSISDSKVITLEPGLYSLTYKLLGNDQHSTEILFSFARA